MPHGVEYAGKSAHDKIREVQALLKDENVDAVLLTMLDSIAWLFNIRGGDIRHTPVALAFAIVPASGRPTLYIDGARSATTCTAACASLSISPSPPR